MHFTGVNMLILARRANGSSGVVLQIHEEPDQVTWRRHGQRTCGNEGEVTLLSRLYVQNHTTGTRSVGHVTELLRGSACLLGHRNPEKVCQVT